MDIFYIFLIAATVGLIYFNFERIKLALKSVKNIKDKPVRLKGEVNIVSLTKNVWKWSIIIFIGWLMLSILGGGWPGIMLLVAAFYITPFIAPPFFVYYLYIFLRDLRSFYVKKMPFENNENIIAVFLIVVATLSIGLYLLYWCIMYLSSEILVN